MQYQIAVLLMRQLSTRISSFIFTVLFDVYSTTQHCRLLSQLPAIRPASLIGCGSVRWPNLDSQASCCPSPGFSYVRL